MIKVHSASMIQFLPLDDVKKCASTDLFCSSLTIYPISILFNFQFCPIFNFVQFSILFNFQFCPFLNFVQFLIFNFVQFSILSNFQFYPYFWFCQFTILSRAVDWNFRSCFHRLFQNSNFGSCDRRHLAAILVIESWSFLVANSARKMVNYSTWKTCKSLTLARKVEVRIRNLVQSVKNP